MNFRRYLSNLSISNRMLAASMVSNIILALAVLGFVVFYSSRDIVTRIIPAGMTQEASISSRSANAEYKKSIGLFVATMTANLQPQTAPAIIDEMSAFFEPSVFRAYRDVALDIVTDPVLSRSKTVKTFLPDSVIYESATDRVFVLGASRIVGAGIDQADRMVFEMSIGIARGRPIVTYIKSYKGNQPETLKNLLLKYKNDYSKFGQNQLPLVRRDVTPDDKAQEVVDGRGDVDAAPVDQDKRSLTGN